ncbi:MAG TPA: pyridoxal-phosphate dependent enzyme [Pyrinomonadaceae bacterium]|jgi:threonine dehydratase|nr:pyridoxal-phosphate dependent enzyme [Pyrinomonadaceae bacterium]
MKTLLEAIRPTTFIESIKLRDHLGLDIMIASETFQHTGSFKFRAAYNVAINVPSDELIGVSSGNFGQALALAAKLTGKKCTVIMPDNSAQVKVDAVRSYGAEADLINVREVSRTERLKQLSDERPDAYLASAFDDKYVISGNSTLGDELIEKKFDAVIVPIGGGGLSSGIIQSFQRNNVDTEVYAAEPLIANDAARSIRAGELIANETEPQTIADGARTLSVGNLNWPILKDGIAGVLEVSEEEIAEALRIYFVYANLKCEPTGALPLGAILTDKKRFADKKICLIVSGGNVDPVVYAKLLVG